MPSSGPLGAFGLVASHHRVGVLLVGLGHHVVARGEFAGARAGTVTAGLVFGGDGPPSTTPPGYMDHTEKYDGTSWSETANVNTARHSGNSMGAGNTAAIFVGGRLA